jgi:hypothetical protein
LTSFYPLLTLISIVIFAGLGWFLAGKRNRNGVLWLVLGAFFPPLLLILFFMKPAEPDGEEDDDKAGGGELSEG